MNCNDRAGVDFGQLFSDERKEIQIKPIYNPLYHIKYVCAKSAKFGLRMSYNK